MPWLCGKEGLSWRTAFRCLLPFAPDLQGEVSRDHPGPLGHEALGSKPLSIEKREYTRGSAMAPLSLSNRKEFTLPVGSRAVL